MVFLWPENTSGPCCRIRRIASAMKGVEMLVCGDKYCS